MDQVNTITGDAQIDTMKTTRWKTKDNVKFLFEETDCHLIDENLCKDQPEGGLGTGTQRIFNLNPPYFGLGTLLSKVELIIEQMSMLDPDRLLRTDITNEEAITMMN
ncbi:MAG: hypothetical protein EZS28_027006 [Streblomastix strix]|uniref:Uncharacterized protein n=1 Tax=Streblomastix strix TaxID=222440 RepID=A0A5J4V4E2_9EUKA|nr:MAG: hypothetical protein EZS28_027006 [Streblomastix strix]